MYGDGVPELFDIDFLEGDVYIVGNLLGNGTSPFRVSFHSNPTSLLRNSEYQLQKATGAKLVI